MAGRYDDALLDAEILRSQRSDRSYVATRVGMLAITFFFLARAVLNGATAGFLLLPLVVEFLGILWLGLTLGCLFAHRPEFIEPTCKPFRVVFWTLALLGAVSAVLAWEGGGFDAARIRPGWENAWQESRRTGLVWAILAEVVGLVVSTARELVDWRRRGGLFVWRSVFAPSFRLAVVILLGVLSPFVLIPLGDSLVPWLFETPQRLAWTAFGALLVVELGGLGVGVGLHRSLSAAQASPEGSAQEASPPRR